MKRLVVTLLLGNHILYVDKIRVDKIRVIFGETRHERREEVDAG